MAQPEGLKSKDLFPGIFSRHAAAYQRRIDEIMARGEARGRMRAIEVASPRPGMRILDLGCGPGNLSRRLAELVLPGGEVVGVDLAPGMIELARAGAIPNASFEVMDIEQLRFADDSFDAAVCGHALQFVPDLDRALREARRVLRGDGRLGASMPATEVNESLWRLLESVVDRWLPPAPTAADRTRTRETILNPDALRKVAVDAGFRSARVELIEEEIHWESVEHLVSLFTSWWDCASRLEGIDPATREAFIEDALSTLRHEYPGPIVTTARNHVLAAQI